MPQYYLGFRRWVKLRHFAGGAPGFKWRAIDATIALVQSGALRRPRAWNEEGVAEQAQFRPGPTEESP